MNVQFSAKQPIQRRRRKARPPRSVAKRGKKYAEDWLAKYHFLTRKTKLNKKSARRWATRSFRVRLETEKELGRRNW